MRRAARRLVCGLAVASLAPACSLLGLSGGPEVEPLSPSYWPDRRDYATFREARPILLEPNYLPFMVHRVKAERGDPRGDPLIFCRWDDAQMPLRVYVGEPDIPESLQDEFHPTDPRFYVARVEYALGVWEQELEGLVRFQIVEDAEDAALHIRLVPERAPTRGEGVVLGATEALLRACRTEGWDPDSERMQVRFRVPELLLYLADEYGLLTTGQVERVALHELGHALGMIGHSPIPSDMMYRAYRERSAVETLSEADVNSFVSLYRLPNGAHYAYAPRGEPPPPPEPTPPAGAPQLVAAPHVDPMRGFAVRMPRGWISSESPRGIFAANGPVWDFDASIELGLWPYASIEELIARNRLSLFEGDWYREQSETQLAGAPALRISVEDATGRWAKTYLLAELGDGRVLVALTQCPLEHEAAWAPWFEASLATLRLWEQDGVRFPGRDH